MKPDTYVPDTGVVTSCYYVSLPTYSFSLSFSVFSLPSSFHSCQSLPFVLDIIDVALSYIDTYNFANNMHLFSPFFRNKCNPLNSRNLCLDNEHLRSIIDSYN